MCHSQQHEYLMRQYRECRQDNQGYPFSERQSRCPEHSCKIGDLGYCGLQDEPRSKGSKHHHIKVPFSGKHGSMYVFHSQCMEQFRHSQYGKGIGLCSGQQIRVGKYNRDVGQGKCFLLGGKYIPGNFQECGQAYGRNQP